MYTVIFFVILAYFYMIITEHIKIMAERRIFMLLFFVILFKDGEVIV